MGQTHVVSMTSVCHCSGMVWGNWCWNVSVFGCHNWLSFLYHLYCLGAQCTRLHSKIPDTYRIHWSTVWLHLPYPARREEQNAVMLINIIKIIGVATNVLVQTTRPTVDTSVLVQGFCGFKCGFGQVEKGVMMDMGRTFRRKKDNSCFSPMLAWSFLHRRVSLEYSEHMDYR